MSAGAVSRLRWAPSVRFESGAYRDRRLAEVAAFDPTYVCTRAYHPRPDWSHSLVVALRIVAHELACSEETAAA